MIKSYLNERIQKVTLSTCQSDWIQLYQGVPQGTILGPLLFKIYVNNMVEKIDNSCNLVQYADDTMIFTSNKDVYDSLKALEKNILHLERYFESHLLTINASKTEFIVSSKPHKNRVMENLKLEVKGQFIKATNSIKYLGVYLDRNLTFQEEVKHVLRKMACGIKTIYSIRNYFPMKTRLLLLNALVISHLHYPAILLNGISENLITTLEKQLNWAIKACFNRTKIESSSDLETKHKILSVRYLLRARSTIYYWKYRKTLIPAFLDELKLPTDDVIEHKRTHSLALNYTPKSQFLYNCFFKSIIPCL